VVIPSRPEVIPLLHTVTVAPISTTIYGVPSEVVVKHPSAVNCDHLQTVAKAQFHSFTGSLDETQMTAICAAVAIALGCDVQRASPVPFLSAPPVAGTTGF
jgi:mRNA interferase MazF